MGQPEPPFTVLAGHTYREPVQVFNRCVMPVYQTAYRWTGNRPDAEEVTASVFVNGFRSLDLPQPVIKVHDKFIEDTIETIGRHWADRYGVSPQRWSTVRAGEVAAPLRSTLSLRALLDPLPGDLRLVTVLRFLRRRTVDQIAAQLGVSQSAAAVLIFRALSWIGTEMGFGAPVDDTSQAGELARFEATPVTFQAMLAATCVHASIAGNDLPSPRFVRSLAEGVR